MTHPPPDPKRLAADQFIAAQLREKVARLPLGLECVACRCTRFKVTSVRRLPGEIVRVKKCRRCRTKLYSIERAF
jgi:hypothetical protein